MKARRGSVEQVNAAGRAARLRRGAALALLAVALVLLAWSLWPVQLQTAVIDLPAEALQAGGAPGAAPAAQAGGWRLELTWPRALRLGESAVMHLDLSQVGGAAQPADLDGGALLARLELPGLPYTPQGETRQSLHGRGVDFFWTLRAAAPGEYGGAVWLHRLIPAEDGQPEQRQVISAQRFRVRCAGFLGLSGVWAQALGIAGVAIGIVFGLDGVLVWFWRRFIIQ